MHEFDVELAHVQKFFGKFCAIEDFSLGVIRGEFLTLLGPSGCGKTTVMKIIAGLIQPTSGDVLIRGERINERAAYERDVSLMFQNYALFPHKSVFDNIAFGLKYRGIGLEERKRRVRAILDLVRLPDIEDRYPHQLSGGQQQRVALARSLVVNPAVVLLDEPLSNLDQKLRVGMQLELKQIQEKSGITFVFVTHDQGEALALSDRVVVINEGKILQVGTPREVYERPQSRFVADFIGQSNFFEGTITQLEGSLAQFTTDNGASLYSTRQNAAVSLNARVTLQIRAEHVKLAFEKPSDSTNCFKGIVERSAYEGTYVIYQVRLDDGQIIIAREPASRRQLADRGSVIWVVLASDNCVLLS